MDRVKVSTARGGGHTSEVSVEVVQPFDLGLHLVPHGLLQSLPLGGAVHQCVVRLRDPVDLQLQLKEEEMFTLYSFSRSFYPD